MQKLFGRMMRQSTAYNADILRAIYRIRGDSVTLRRTPSDTQWLCDSG